MATHSSTLAWKNPMDRGAWWAAVHEVGEIPWTEESGGLQSMGLQRTGCNLVTKQQQLSVEAYLPA